MLGYRRTLPSDWKSDAVSRCSSVGSVVWVCCCCCCWKQKRQPCVSVLRGCKLIQAYTARVVMKWFTSGWGGLFFWGGAYQDRWHEIKDIPVCQVIMQLERCGGGGDPLFETRLLSWSYCLTTPPPSPYPSPIVSVPQYSVTIARRISVSKRKAIRIWYEIYIRTALFTPACKHCVLIWLLGLSIFSREVRHSAAQCRLSV